MAKLTCFPRIFVRAEPFETDGFDSMLAGDDDTGALARFTGKCRSENGALAALELEHYPGMAEQQLYAIASDAMNRWPAVTGIVVVHRYGMIQPGENIVHVAATSAHRDAAFDAVRFVMDYLKTDAPFWKKEHAANGKDVGWINAKPTDDAARERWKKR